MAGEKLGANPSAREEFLSMQAKLRREALSTRTDDPSIQPEGLPTALDTRTGRKIRATNPSDVNALTKAVIENPDIEPYSPPSPNESRKS